MFFHVYERDIAPTVEVLHVAASDAKTRTLVHLSRALVEVGNIEDHTSSRKAFMSELQAETDEGEAEAATGQIRPHPETVEDSALSFFEIQRTGEATVLVANHEESLPITNWLAVVVVEVIRGVVSPARPLRKRRIGSRFDTAPDRPPGGLNRRLPLVVTNS